MENAELAYLLGMITGKGTLVRGNTQTDIIIEITHKNLISEGMNARLSVKASLDDIRNSIEPLVGARLLSTQVKSKTVIKFTKDNEDFLIREINRHFQRITSCKDMRIPKGIFTTQPDIKREFMIGLADVTAHIRSSNIAYGLPYNHRAYIEIPVNWYLVIDICNLLLDLDVPVHTIDWGHPNTRDSQLKEYNAGRINAWFREHQVKIFVDEFEKVGFRIVHKMDALKKLADLNRKAWDNSLREKIKTAHSEKRKEKLKKMLGHLELQHHKFYWETKELNRPNHRILWKTATRFRRQ